MRCRVMTRCHVIGLENVKTGMKACAESKLRNFFGEYFTMKTLDYLFLFMNGKLRLMSFINFTIVSLGLTCCLMLSSPQALFGFALITAESSRWPKKVK